LKQVLSCPQQKLDQHSAIPWKECEIGCKLVCTQAFKWYPKVVTLNDPELGNGHYFASFHPKQ